MHKSEYGSCVGAAHLHSFKPVIIDLLPPPFIHKHEFVDECVNVMFVPALSPCFSSPFPNKFGRNPTEVFAGDAVTLFDNLAYVPRQRTSSITQQR